MKDSQQEDERKIAVLIPCLNEEKTIAQVVRDFQGVLPSASIYVFDNNSTDRTAVVARASGAQVVRSSRPGKGNVVRHMFRDVEADLYVMVDGDGTYPASEAGRLLELFREKNADMVVGARVTAATQNSAAAYRRFHVAGNRLVARLISGLFTIPVTDVFSGYRVFSREFAKTVPLLSEGFEVETEMTLQAADKGFRVAEAQVSYGVRPEGSHSKLNTYLDGFLVLRLLLWLVKDYRPLLFFTILSGLFGLAAIASGWAPVQDFVQTGLVIHQPRAILAAGLGVVSALCLSVGLILDSTVKYHRENFELLRKAWNSNTAAPITSR